MGVVRRIENTPTDPATNKPLEDVVIENCGELKEGEDDGITNIKVLLYIKN